MSSIDSLELANGLLKNDLFYATTYLESKFPMEFFLTDAASENHFFWLAEGSCFLFEKSKDKKQEKETLEIIDQKCNWAKSTKTLSYYISASDISFYVSARPVYRPQIQEIANAIKEMEPTIQKYLSLYTLAQHNISIFDSPMQTHFFYNNSFDQIEFFRQTKTSLDNDKLYCVCIKDFSPNNSITPHQLLGLGEKKRGRRSDPLFNFVYGNRSIMIYSLCHKSNYDQSKDYAASVRKTTINVMKDSTIPYIVNSGVGSPHTPDTLFDSYKEAFFSLASGMLNGQENFVKSFAELGVYSIILDRPIKELVQHSRDFFGCMNSKEDDVERLDTLRALIRNNMSYKQTAASLYIHPNTLHYRVNKALETLRLDLSDTDDLTKLYTEVRIYDILRFCDFIN